MHVPSARRPIAGTLTKETRARRNTSGEGSKCRMICKRHPSSSSSSPPILLTNPRVCELNCNKLRSYARCVWCMVSESHSQSRTLGKRPQRRKP